MATALNMTLPLRQDVKIQEQLKELRESFSRTLQAKIHQALFASEKVHYARLLLIGEEGKYEYLQILTEFDGTNEDYTEFFRENLQDVFKMIFSVVEGAPPWDQINTQDEFFKFSRKFQVRSLGESAPGSQSEGFLFCSYGDATVKQIKRALDAQAAALTNASGFAPPPVYSAHHQAAFAPPPVYSAHHQAAFAPPPVYSAHHQAAFAPPPVYSAHHQAAFAPPPVYSAHHQAAFAPPPVYSAHHQAAFAPPPVYSAHHQAAFAPPPVYSAHHQAAFAPPPVYSAHHQAAFAPPPVYSAHHQAAFAPPPVYSAHHQAAFAPPPVYSTGPC